jgi:hypothetical protein
LTEGANVGTVEVLRAGARIGVIVGKGRRIWAPVTSAFILQIDAEVNYFSGI